MTNLLIASTEESEYFAKRIADQMETAGLGLERHTFADGEKHLCFELAQRNVLFGKNAIFVASTHTDEDLLELQRIGCALAKSGARQRVFVIPFLGYSTMERAVRPGEVVTAKTNARMLSGIPNSGLGNTFLFMDLHVSGLTHYFEGDCVPFELYAESVLVAAIKRLGLTNFVLASADLGRTKWIETFATIFDVDMAVIRKQRKDGTSHVQSVIGDVKGKDVVIYDDMTRTGVTAINAAKAYKDAGANDVYLVLSHFAVNDYNVVRALQGSCIKKIITTNTHPASEHILVPLLARGDRASYFSKFEVLDVTPIFVETLKDIFGQE